MKRLLRSNEDIKLIMTWKLIKKMIMTKTIMMMMMMIALTIF